MKEKLIKAKEKTKLCIYYVLTEISPELNTQAHFFSAYKKFGNLKNPETFSEKLSWLKLNVYPTDTLVRQCADKVAVRDYVEACGLGDMLNEVHGIYDSFSAIPWEKLPESFVLKWNFGSGFNYICKNKVAENKAALQKKFDRWEKNKFWNYHAELQYKDCKKQIICERYLESDSPLLDYKFYCFHGEAKAVLVISRPQGTAESAVFMSPEWEYLSDIPYRYSSSFIPERPESLLEMVKAAEKLSAPFPFVRVDFYEWIGKPIFGEMTFTPATGVKPSETMVDGVSMGEMIVLP